jgi:hypothetical protein
MWLEVVVDGRPLRVEVHGERGRYTVTVQGQTLQVDARPLGAAVLSLIVDSESHTAAVERREGGYTVHLGEDTLEVELEEAAAGAAAAPRRVAAGELRVTAPMPGRLVRCWSSRGRTSAPARGSW